MADERPKKSTKAAPLAARADEAGAASPPTASKANDRPGATQVRAAELRQEFVGIVLLGCGVTFACALLTFDPRDMDVIAAGRSAADGVQNAIGPVGARIADLLLHLLGVGALLLDGLVLLLGVHTLMGRARAPSWRVGLGLLGFSFAVLIATHLTLTPLGVRPFGKDPAGLLPGAAAVLCKALVSTTGTALFAGILALASLAALANRSLLGAALQWAGGRAKPAVAGAAGVSVDAARSGWSSLRGSLGKPRFQLDDDAMDGGPARDDGTLAIELRVADLDGRPAEPAAAARPLPSPPLAPVAPGPRENPVATLPDALPDPLATAVALRRPGDVPAAMEPRRPTVPGPVPAPVVGSVASATSLAAMLGAPAAYVGIRPAAYLGRPAAAVLHEGGSTLEMDVADIRRAHDELAGLDDDELPAEAVFVLPPSDETFAPPAPITGVPAAAGALSLLEAVKGPRLIETEAMRPHGARSPADGQQGALAINVGKAWTLPPATIFQDPPRRVVECDEAVLRENAMILQQKLADFNIAGEVVDVRPGPVVTTYEFRPAPGVQAKRIANRAEDLMMSLAALRVRVVAPIPGRDVAGIEVPNQKRQFVYFREIVEAAVFKDSPSVLTLAMGKDLEGRPVVMDLQKAPHLLVAGSTGTGKSVGINSFICSMLCKASPDQVKFIFIDPKMVELSMFEGIPHLLVPVVTEVRKAELALKWAVGEMDRRFKVMQESQVKNLAGYKQKLPELKAEALRRRAKALEPDSEGNTTDLDTIDVPEDMPHIVIVIDEFADLIMQAGKEVEMPVARLAQKARAAGMHVILATQRPSTDVITGVIKSNFATRVSFQVASQIDSKVVLDRGGAEMLLGKGDMLYLPPGEGMLRRCHGTWITDEEVLALAKHWKVQGAPSFDMDVLHDPESEGKGDDDDDQAQDALYDQAVRCVVEANQASVSFLQRKLGIGYGRSAKMVDLMERRGVVGPSRGPNKPREVLMNHV